MNEYRNRLLGLLGTDSPWEVLEATPARVAALIERLGEEGLGSRFEPGKWTGREVVGHLADVEIGVGFRIRQIVSEPDRRARPQSPGTARADRRESAGESEMNAPGGRRARFARGSWR